MIQLQFIDANTAGFKLKNKNKQRESTGFHMLTTLCDYMDGVQ